MDNIDQQLISQMFSPLRATFSRQRPDGGIVISLLNETDNTAYSRVLSPAQRADAQAIAQSLEDIRLELAMRAGNIPADLRKALKEQDSIISYQAS